MRLVYFRTCLRLALRLLRRPPAPRARAAVRNPNAPWAFSVDGVPVAGWRSFDGTGVVAAPGFHV